MIGKEKAVRRRLEPTPETRRSKIARLKKPIKQGTYQVGPGDIAEKWLKDLLLQFTLTSNAGENQTTPTSDIG